MSDHYKIGNVRLQSLSKRTEKFMYSDGDVEDEILELFKNGLSSKKRKEILNSDPSWAVRYHLAYERANLLNWYKFKKGARILEVGSGCGAITEELVKSDASIVANELSERRATVNAHRNKNAKNLEIVIGNLQDYHPVEKFDYVVCVGVLEYAGTFIHSTEPYHEFVKLLGTFLNPGGTVLIAIENKLGLKYFAGAREDHTRRHFDGINNYPQDIDVKTFGKQELTSLLLECGMGVKQFYYPHPDYKTPQVVYSDRFLPGIHTSLPKSKLPSPNFDQPRDYLFSEQQLALSLEKNKLFDYFANSFLVEGVKSRGTLDRESGVAFSLTSINRLPEYQIRTTAYKHNKGSELCFRKEAVTEESIPHIQRMFETYTILKNTVGKNSLIKVVPPIMVKDNKSKIDFNFIPGQSAEDILLQAILDDKISTATEVIRKFNSILEFLSSKTESNSIDNKRFSEYFGSKEISKLDLTRVVKSGLLDLNFDNFIIEEKTGQWWLIDYEWRLETPIPTEFIKYRALMYFFSRHRSMIQNRSNKIEVLQNNLLAIPKSIVKECGIALGKIDLVRAIESKHLQVVISGSTHKYPRMTKYLPAQEERYYMDVTQEKLDASITRIEHLEKENQDLKTDYQHLEDHIVRIRSSKTYRAVAKAAAVKRIIKP